MGKIFEVIHRFLGITHIIAYLGSFVCYGIGRQSNYVSFFVSTFIGILLAYYIVYTILFCYEMSNTSYGCCSIACKTTLPASLLSTLGFGHALIAFSLYKILFCVPKSTSCNKTTFGIVNCCGSLIMMSIFLSRSNANYYINNAYQICLIFSIIGLSCGVLAQFFNLYQRQCDPQEEQQQVQKPLPNQSPSRDFNNGNNRLPQVKKKRQQYNYQNSQYNLEGNGASLNSMHNPQNLQAGYQKQMENSIQNNSYYNNQKGANFNMQNNINYK